MKNIWLKCQVAKGMFPDERTVTLNTEPDKVSVFCHKDFVENDMLKVALIEERNREVLVRLPVESPVGQLFWVSMKDVAECAV
jgi:hypothetical protein